MTGHLHPTTIISYRLVSFLKEQGFCIYDGPEIVHPEENFDWLNIPVYHPARDQHDTFYTADNRLLRTHTSAMQVPIIRKIGAPARAAFLGRVFRNEATDATHATTFTQLEGVCIEKDASIATLRWTIEELLKTVFDDKKLITRFRPSYFPFVMPGFEVDVLFSESSSQREDWLEVLGAGMIDQTVIRAMNLDPQTHYGFAFGIGIDRLLCLRTDLTDIRLINSGNYLYLAQHDISK